MHLTPVVLSVICDPGLLDVLFLEASSLILDLSNSFCLMGLYLVTNKTSQSTEYLVEGRC